MNVFLVLCCLSTGILSIKSTNNLADLGFPNAWDGDKFHNFPCPSETIPRWLDGHFLVQVCGSYGDQKGPPGSKVTHMFDAIGAVISLELKNGEVKFSAEYYPAKPNRIWNFYGRNMTRSQLAWHPVRSPYNETAVQSWEPMMKNDDSFPIHPNFNFWLLGNRIIATTEILQLGLQFNVSSLSNFSSTNLRDVSNTNPTLMVLSVGSQEREGLDGSVYAGAAAYDPSVNKMYHIIYSIHPNGDRTTEATHEYGTYDPTSCNDDGSYNGDKRNLAGYIHSITSTKSYVILPIGSNVINPCKLQPLNKNNQSQINGDIKMDNPAMEFVANQPVRFLIFDKSSKQFITQSPVEVGIASVFITSQINAYEDNNGVIITDMIGFENVNPYDLLTTEKLINVSTNSLPTMNLYRFRINPRSNNNNQRPNYVKINYQQPSYNKRFEEAVYKFAYTVSSPFTSGNSILKIDVQSQSIVNEFNSPNPNTAFREPIFVPKDKSSMNEDDGVILFLGGDISTEKSSLYVLDAKNFTMLGCATLPTFVPFGFSSRYFMTDDLICSANCQNVRRQSNYNSTQQSQLSVQTNDQMYQNGNFSSSSSNQFGMFGSNQMYQNGNISNQTGTFSNNQMNQSSVSTNFSSFSDQTTTINELLLSSANEGLTPFSRIDNVTVYPASTNQTDTTITMTVQTTTTIRSSTSGNTLISENDSNSFAGVSNSMGPTNSSLLDTSSTNTEFFRTTTIMERSAQPSISDIIASTNVAYERTTINSIDNINDNLPPLTSNNTCHVKNDSSPWTWLRFVHAARKLICSFYKQPIDKTGLDFCLLDANSC